MISFTFSKDKKSGFIPTLKITNYCSKNGLEYFSRYGTTYVNYQCGVYTYSHYTITPETENQERVEIYLKKVS